MPKLIVLIALAAVVLLSWHQLRAMPAAKRKRYLLQIGFWGLVGLIIIAVVTGRLHWVGAVIAGALGVVKAILPRLWRYLPLLMPLFKRYSGTSDTKNANHNETPPETIVQAFTLLDLPLTASKEDVIEAHRKKMQKAHPDKGGNHEMAAKLNEAKQQLLEYLEH